MGGYYQSTQGWGGKAGKEAMSGMGNMTNPWAAAGAAALSQEYNS